MANAALGLLTRRERLWPAVGVSMALHAAALAAAVLHRPVGLIDLEQKPIVAKLVRLGEKKPENWLPRKDEPPPEAAPPAPVPGPAPAQALPKPPPGAAKPRPDALAKALNRIRRDQVLSPPAYGDLAGDPEGSAEEASAGDHYLALVTRVLQASYQLPATISEKDRMFLRATVVLFIEPDGRVARYRFERKSGNEAYDSALERAIRRTRLPPPPAELRERYRSLGLGVNFHV